MMRLRGVNLFLSQLQNDYRTNFIKRSMALSSTHVKSEVKPFSAVPGLSSLPVLGHLHHFLPVIGEIGPVSVFSKMGDLHAKYGPILKMQRPFSKNIFLFMFEPEHYEQVFNAEESSPLRPGFEVLAYYREVLRKNNFEGIHGLSTAQGPKWRDFRTKVNPAMLKPKIIKLYTPGLEEIANDLVAKITKYRDQGDYLDLGAEISKWSLESIALVCLGSRLGCLRDDLPEDHPAMQLVKCVQEMVELIFKLEFMPSLWRFKTTPNYKKIIELFDKQWEISQMYITQTKKSIDTRGRNIPDEDKSILEKLLAIDEKVALMMANEMLMAGIDTVAFAVTSLLYNLATNPQAQDKLREEIRTNANNRYLRACMKESLRIWHVIPVNLRRTTKEHVVGGYRIPEGIDVMSPNQYLSSLDIHYPHAKEFLPERWLVNRDDPLYHANAHPMVSLPFGFGVRSCIGRRMAELEVELFTKRMIDQYEVLWEGPPAKLVMKLFNSLEKPLRFRFKRAK